MTTSKTKFIFALLGGQRAALGLVVCSLGTMAIGQCPPTPSPIPETCPTSSTCLFPTPTATPVASPAHPAVINPTPTPAYYTGSKFLEAQYASFGNRWGQRPKADGANAFQFLWGLPMSYNTRVGNSPSPSIYSPLVSQAIYWQDLWEPFQQERDFADRTQHLLGSYAASVLSLDSGSDMTRDGDQPGKIADQKYAIGEVHMGMALRGGVFGPEEWQRDGWNILGSANFGMASIQDHSALEPGGTENWRRRVYLNQVTGSENAAWLARILRPRLTDTTKPGPIDVREGYWHEDSEVNLVPADVNAMFGTSNLVFLDNKRGDYCSERVAANDPPRQGGFMNVGFANRAIVAAFTKGSWVNAGDMTSYWGQLIINDAWFGKSGWYCGTNGERSGSTIRNYTGIRILAPYINPCDPLATTTASTGVRSSRAFEFYDFDPESGGGASALVSANVDQQLSGFSVEVEKHAGIVRGSMIVGDSQNGSTDISGYDTDVLHVRDVIHLTPRTQPPQFDESLPPSERVGLLYYDLEKNSLRLSVAAQNPSLSGKGDWKDAEVVWVDLEMATAQIEPVVDVAGADTSADSLAYKTADEVRNAIEFAKTTVAAGTSPYLHPKLEIAGPVLKDVTTASFTMLYSGFGGDTPHIYWRLQSVDQNMIPQETHWQKIAESDIAPVAGLDLAGGAAVAIIAPTTIDEDGNVMPLDCSGSLLQLFAINRMTGQSCGTSVRM